MTDQTLRRNVVKSAAAAFTTNLFTGRVFGANDTLQTAFIGMGRMGTGNMNAAMKQDKLHVAAVCDIYQPALDAETAVAWLNAVDAATRGIADGDAVRLFNDRGEVRALAAVDGKTAPGVVAVPAVRWPKRSAGRAGLNTLITDRLTDLGGGATFYSCLIQVERCAN